MNKITETSEPGFTKGDWSLRGLEVGVYDTSDTQSRGMMRSICFVDEYDFQDNCAINAHLIAAAPEMYALLSRMKMQVSVMSEGYGADINASELIEECESLLAKARGEKL